MIYRDHIDLGRNRYTTAPQQPTFRSVCAGEVFLLFFSAISPITGRAELTLSLFFFTTSVSVITRIHFSRTAGNITAVTPAGNKRGIIEIRFVYYSYVDEYIHIKIK